YVDEHGAGFDHVGRDEACATDGGDPDVGVAGEAGEVAGLAVADGDGGGVVEEHGGGGFADDVGAADDDGVLAGDGEVAALEDLDDAGGGAGREAGLAGEQAAGVDGVE